MTTILAGKTATVTVQWRQYEGGPGADVTGLTITIKALDGTIIVGPTSTGITHPALGLYAYAWAVLADQAPGDYVLIWDGTDADSEAVQASEVITVTATPDTDTWPPVLDELKSDLGLPPGDTRTDVKLQRVLDASVAFVEGQKRSVFDFSNGEDSGCDLLPPPTADVRLGTIRLASRWHTRGRSPDGLIAMAEMGSARVPSFDADIERLLGIGRYSPPVIA